MASTWTSGQEQVTDDWPISAVPRFDAPRRGTRVASSPIANDEELSESLVVAIVQSWSIYQAGNFAFSSRSVPLRSVSCRSLLPLCLTSASLPGSRNRFQCELNLALIVAFAVPSSVYKAPLLLFVSPPSFPARARSHLRCVAAATAAASAPSRVVVVVVVVDVPPVN